MKFIRTLILCQTLCVCLLGFTEVRANPSEGTEEISCSIGWNKVHRGCYMFVTTEELEWDDAKTHCVELGGDLTSIQSWNEKEELRKYVNTKEPDTKTWWVGLRRTLPDVQDWKWLDDHPLDSNVLPWTDTNQVNRAGLCGMIAVASEKVTASVSRCSTELPFICEYHSITKREITEATTVTSTTDSTTSPPTSSPTQSDDNCPCRDSTDFLTSDSSESHETRLNRRNQELNVDEKLYQRYLQSEIDANNAKVKYYSEVAKLYEEALQAQNQYYNKHQVKLDLEISQLREGPKCT